jgi:glycosyltransferase involved in cell wall biosynthesis
MKYSILMPFINRGGKLIHTLNSFKNLYRDRNDYEVIIIEDAKNEEDIAPILDMYRRSFGMNIQLVKSKIQDCYNPAPLFNEGAIVADGEILILTSPEILHASDVLGGLDDEFTETPLDDLKYVICSCKNQGNRDNLPWYQHSMYRNKQYHFCSAMSRDLYSALQGFDNEYGKGIAYDDDDFLRTIKNGGKYNLVVEIITRDDLETHHQWHAKITVRVPGYREKLMINRNYYERKWGERIAI